MATQRAAGSLESVARGSIEKTQSQGPPTGSPSIHLDALRGFAAFSVLLNHWRDAFFVDYRALPHHSFILTMAYLLAGLGRQWVIVFFVMSGYLVGGSVIKAVHSERWTWPGYLLSRLTRLYIVLLPALLLGGAMDWIGMHLPGTAVIYSGHSGMHALTANVHSTLTLPVLLGNAFFLQTTAFLAKVGHAAPPFGSNGSLWSLSNEFWYYMAFPPLVFLLARGRSWRMRMIYAFCLLAWGWFVGRDIVLLGIPWLTGVLIPFLPPIPSRRRWVRISAIALALAFLGGGLVLDKLLNSFSGDLVLGCTVALLIWVTMHCAISPVPPAYARIAQRAARSSYTLYLVHLPLLILLKASLHLPRAVPGWHNCLLCMGLLVVILLYAQLVYQIFEKHTDQVREWLKPYVLARKKA